MHNEYGFKEFLMALLNMVYAPDPRLKKNCDAVTDINNDMRQLADDMLETMYEKEGVGLAAPQIGETIRLFVMDCEQIAAEEEDGKSTPGKPYKLFNPVILEASEETNEREEGCLSLPGVLQPVTRPKKVTVEYFDENGNKQTLKADDLTATCIQHELDHLNGTLLTDYMGPVKRQMTLKKLRKWKKDQEHQ